jgi:MYXO-CTERM domain-containing protein
MDGAVPESAFTWQVDFQHDAHSHPLVAAMSGRASLSFKVPDFEAAEANTWLRVSLTAKDTDGAHQTVTRDVFPATQLSSLDPVVAMNAWGPFERNRSNGEDAVDGKPLSIAGITFPTGLGVHAPAELSFDLGKRCNGKFLADVGVDDEVRDQGSVVFQVYLDAQLAYDSGVLRGMDGRASIALDVAGVEQLRLVVTDGGDGMGSDHGDWGAARVTGCPRAMPSDPAGSDAGSSAPAQGTAGAGGAAGAGSNAGAGGTKSSQTSEPKAGRGGSGGSTGMPSMSSMPEGGSTAADAGAAAAMTATDDGAASGTSAPESSVEPSQSDAARPATASPAQPARSDGGCSTARAPGDADLGAAFWSLLALAALGLRRRVRSARQAL